MPNQTATALPHPPHEAEAQGRPREAITVSLAPSFWRIVTQDAADLGEERGSRVTPTQWIEEAIIERDLAQRHQIRVPRRSGEVRRSLTDVTRDYVAEVIESTDYNISQAARIAGVDRHTLARYLQRFQLSRGDSEDEAQSAVVAGGDDLD